MGENIPAAEGKVSSHPEQSRAEHREKEEMI
jgi:hypothetical protein